MAEKIISLENREGPFQAVFQRVMRMVPERDKEDTQLQRLLAFRLEIDGESETIEYLMAHVRDYIQCGHKGSLYSFMTMDEKIKAKTCGASPADRNPPESA
jgi:hypothetical protein